MCSGGAGLGGEGLRCRCLSGGFGVEGEARQKVAGWGGESKTFFGLYSSSQDVQRPLEVDTSLGLQSRQALGLVSHGVGVLAIGGLVSLRRAGMSSSPLRALGLRAATTGEDRPPILRGVSAGVARAFDLPGRCTGEFPSWAGAAGFRPDTSTTLGGPENSGADTSIASSNRGLGEAALSGSNRHVGTDNRSVLGISAPCRMSNLATHSSSGGI